VRPVVPDVSSRCRLRAPGRYLGDLFVFSRLAAGGEHVAKTEEDDRRKRKNQYRKQASRHEYSKFGSCARTALRTGFPDAFFAWTYNLLGDCRVNGSGSTVK
jgi:hypothetical protein